MNSDFLKEKLSQIDKFFKYGIFEVVEDAKLEVKDLSTGSDWYSLRETICAFLNTNGGYVICGIREKVKEKQYKLNGFDRNNENNLIELRTKFFEADNGVFPALHDYINFDYILFNNTNLAIIYVTPVSEDVKFLKFDKKYYERVLAGDKEISPSKIIQQQEYKQEFEYSKELSVVPNATLADLDIDKINQFILKINATVKRETVKKDIEDARSFLSRRHCIKENQVTTLGMLLFGQEPYQYLEERAEVNCYYGVKDDIGQDKQYFQNDVLNLMDDTFRFIWGHIKVGRSYIGGGQSEPEYPEKLIRESINNALAHRDYTANRFVTIKVKPNEQIEITNPGSFKSKIKIAETSTAIEIRRIVPGIPESKNPKLAAILKNFEKIESLGTGMATLVEVCLKDSIDVPYYDLSKPNNITLVIPSGKLIDEAVEFWLNSFAFYLQNKLKQALTVEHKKVLAYFYKSEKLNQRRCYTILLSPSNNHFEVIESLKNVELIYEHAKASSEETPIYILDRELLKTNFDEEIKERIRKQTDVSTNSLFPTYTEYDTFSISQKSVLNIIYRYGRYNQQFVKPTQITPEIYLKEVGKLINPKNYETIGRKVRKICQDFHANSLLIKDEKGGYSIKL